MLPEKSVRSAVVQQSVGDVWVAQLDRKRVWLGSQWLASMRVRKAGETMRKLMPSCYVFIEKVRYKSTD